MGSEANSWASYLRVSRGVTEHRGTWEQNSIILLDKGLKVMPERGDECFLTWDLECNKEGFRAFDLASQALSHLFKKRERERMEKILYD